MGPTVLAITSDQGSQLFKAALHLSLELKLRLVWFPDINHVEHNVDKGIMAACDLEQLSEKALFLGRLHRGPKKIAGKWHGQIKQAHQASFAKLARPTFTFLNACLCFVCVLVGWLVGWLAFWVGWLVGQLIG